MSIENKNNFYNFGGVLPCSIMVAHLWYLDNMLNIVYVKNFFFGGGASLD